MAVTSSQTPSLRREEVPVKENACARLLESYRQAVGEHRQRWERIGAAACGALQQSMESELRLAGKEQTLDDRQQHQRELHQLGKAFYMERL